MENYSSLHRFEHIEQVLGVMTLPHILSTTDEWYCVVK